MLIRANERGFTLNEILVVIGIISILAAIAVPAYHSYKKQAKIAQVMEELKRIETAIIALASDTGQWPGHQTMGEVNNGGSNEIYDLNAATIGLVTDDAGTPYPNWNGPYLPSIPVDPWGTNYFLDTDYRINGVDNIVLGSLGPSRCCNNAYNSDDIRLILPLK